MNRDDKAFIDAINKNTMRRSVAEYACADGLHPALHAGLAVVAAEARNRPILDLGVGAGRTVSALMDISRNYVGVDYIPEMVMACRKRFPDAHFVQADARNLSQFDNDSFFLVVFSTNGICMVNHEGRIAILKEVHRLLEPGGVFLFSTYNRNSWAYNKFFRFPVFEPTKNPVKFMKRGFHFLFHTGIRVVNRIRFRRLEQRLSEYSIINDQCHDYTTMLYYTSIENHNRQLESIGFSGVVAFDLFGQKIIIDSTHDSITFLARKQR